LVDKTAFIGVVCKFDIFSYSKTLRYGTVVKTFISPFIAKKNNYGKRVWLAVM
jgi:hypothetical protein